MLYLSQPTRLMGGGLRATSLHWIFHRQGAGIHLTNTVAGQRSAGSTPDPKRMANGHIGNLEAIKLDSQDFLQLDLQVQQPRIDSSKQQILIDNLRNLDIPKELTPVREEPDAKKRSWYQRVTSNQRKITFLKASNSAQEAYQTMLTGDPIMRSRYLSTYKRDYMHRKTKHDERIITVGNQSAHGGNAVADARLYTMPHGRNDREVFKKLYGLWQGSK